MLLATLMSGVGLGAAVMSMPVDLQLIASAVYERTIAHFSEKPIKREDLALSIASIDPANGTVERADVNGGRNMYPASVVKMFYAAYLAALVDAKKIKVTKEVERGLKDMLYESSNDATGLIFDVITGTTGGPELSEKELKSWMAKRQVVNKWLAARGYVGQNACQKTWNEGPYGRERQGYGPKMELRNSLSANASRDMMVEIALNRVASQERCAWIRSSMLRTKDENGKEAGGQTEGFLGEAFPRGWEVYSKAGLAYEVRHDVCYLKVNGREFVFCVYSDHNITNEKLLPFIGSELMKAFDLRP